MSERLLALLVLLFVAVAVAVLLELPAPGLGPEVRARMADSGVASEVTAVLLNFRALDTLLEVVVLVAAAVGALLLAPVGPHLAAGPAPAPLLAWLGPRLLPLAVVLGIYLWWAGSAHSGGAFQAGAVFAGALLLRALAGQRIAAAERLPVRLLLLAGPLCFLAVAAAATVAGGPLLRYPDGWAGALIVTIEGLVAVSVGAGLALLAAGGRSAR